MIGVPKLDWSLVRYLSFYLNCLSIFRTKLLVLLKYLTQFKRQYSFASLVQFGKKDLLKEGYVKLQNCRKYNLGIGLFYGYDKGHRLWIFIWVRNLPLNKLF